MSGLKYVLTIVLLWTAVIYSPALAGSGNKDPNFASGRHTIVQLFQWRWVDIANECETFLRQYGYGGLQVSPPTENAIIENPGYQPDVYRPWYEIYQPVSYKLETRDGTEAEFQDMVRRCNLANVRVYVDVVVNHMTGDTGSGIGTNGSSWNADTKSYPGVPYTAANFHTCPGDCTTNDCQIQNYNDAYQVRNCELSGLLDLNQGLNDTRNRIIEYLNRLLSYGVAGFRMDAAKHMWPSDLNYIFDNLHDLSTDYFPVGKRPYIYQEVIDYGDTEAVHVGDYKDVGDVTEFKYGKELAFVFRQMNPMKYLENWGEGWGMMNSDDVLAFIDNHDTQRGGGGAGFYVLTFFDSKLYKMANAFMLAHPYGQVRVMSSYNWDRNIQGGTDVNSWYGPPHDSNYNILPVTTNTDLSCDYDNWVCEHRWRQIYNMVRFRNTVNGTPLVNWWSGSNYTIAFSRGNKGFLAINNENFTMNANLFTELPPGTYCDIISGNLEDGSCTGRTVKVDSDGYAQIFIDNLWEDPMIAIYIDAKL